MQEQQDEMTDRTLAVTGAAAVCPLGRSREAIRAALHDGREAFSVQPAPEWTGLQTLEAAWVTDFQASPVIPAMKARRMDRSSQLAIVAAADALHQAGWDVAREGADALGIFLGSGFCGTHSAASILHTLYTQGAEEVSAAAFPNTVPNAPAGQLAIHFGLTGPSATLLQSGTTAEAALRCAQGQLETEQCRAALWGGADELSEYLWFGWRRLGWVGPSSAQRLFGRPFHPLSRGFVAGEGAAMLLVEPAALARARGAAIQAMIGHCATGAVQARPWAYPTADQVGRAVRFFEAACAAAGPPDLVLGCANGHPRLDRFEAEVLGRLVGDRVPVWLPKGQIGETMASAALRAVLAVCLIEAEFVPGNFWLKDQAPAAGLSLPVQSAPRQIRRILVTTISAGGTLGAVFVNRAEGVANTAAA